MNEIKERPILMSGPMVRAILEGRKTVTRRVCKDQGKDVVFEYVEDNPTFPEMWAGRKAEPYTGWVVKYPDCPLWLPRDCPHGKPGDRLWVRETWAHVATMRGKEIWYRATTPEDGNEPVWRPSIFMPRWASRITLEITGVRVERVQDISEEDAVAEGLCILSNRDGTFYNYDSGIEPRYWWVDPISAFVALWQSINGKRPGCSWSANPWVWVISFRRIT